MINSLIEAISIALYKEFGDGYGIHMEEIRQGLEEPCFFIFCISPANRLFLGRRYFRSSRFCIHYIPKTGERQRECNDVAERMYGCLEYIMADGDSKPVRGTKMGHEVVEGILHFFVNYDCFTYRAGEQTAMGGLQSDISVKEGG